MKTGIDQSRFFKFKKTGIKLHTVMLVQGTLWIIAAASLFLLPDVKIANVVLMSILGVLFIGWGFSITKINWQVNSHLDQSRSRNPKRKTV